MKMMATPPKHDDTPNTATVTDYCECGHAPYAHKVTDENDQNYRPCAIYRCNCEDYQHHTGSDTTTEPEPAASERQWTVQPFDDELDGYPLLSPEGLAAIATDPEYQRRILTAVNHHDALVAALENILADCQTAAEKRTRADWDFAVTQAIEYASAALATIRQQTGERQ